MPPRNERALARARLQLETPISDDESLPKLQEQAANYVREAQCCNAQEPDRLVSTVMDAIARDYFRHALRKRRAH